MPVLDLSKAELQYLAKMNAENMTVMQFLERPLKTGALGGCLQWQRLLLGTGPELRVPTTERLFQVSIQHPCPHL